MRGNIFDENENEEEKRIISKEAGIVLIIIFIALPALHYYLNMQQLDDMREDVLLKEEQLEEVQAKYEQQQELREELENYRERDTVEFTRYIFSEAAALIAANMPDPVTLEKIEFHKGTMFIEGYSFYEDSLEEFERYFDDEEKFTYIGGEFKTDNDLYDFEIEIGLDTGEVLP